MKKTFLWFVFLSFAGCTSVQSLRNVLLSHSPYDRYSQQLEEAGLKNTLLATSWKNAGVKVFKDSILTPIPHAESGFFSAEQPVARSYRFDVKEGQVVTVKVEIKAKVATTVFVDLFKWEKEEWKREAFADTGLSFSHEFEKDDLCLLRIQPEVLANLYFTVSISLTPILINPVKGASNKSIGSFYGDARGGGRLHEGVDIFGSKGTPIQAPTSGYISRVGTTTLGGKVVWMYDTKRSHSYYFAHLDTQLVQVGQKVVQGDLIGTVGNTGNAISTPPHLHFGIYQRGSKDPIAFIRTMEKLTRTQVWDTTIRSRIYKTGTKHLTLSRGPSGQYPIKAKLLPEQYVEIMGESGDWFRVNIPHYGQGYLKKVSLTLAEKGKRITLSKETFLYSEPSVDSVPIRALKVENGLEALAKSLDFVFVKTKEGETGWITNDGTL